MKNSSDLESTHFYLQPGGKRWIWEAIEEAVEEPDYWHVQFRSFQRVLVLSKKHDIAVGYSYDEDGKKRPLYAITVVYHEMLNSHHSLSR